MGVMEWLLHSTVAYSCFVLSLNMLMIISTQFAHELRYVTLPKFNSNAVAIDTSTEPVYLTRSLNPECLRYYYEILSQSYSLSHKEHGDI